MISTTARLSASRSSAQRASGLTCSGSMSSTSATQPWKVVNASSRPIFFPSIGTEVSRAGRGPGIPRPAAADIVSASR